MHSGGAWIARDHSGVVLFHAREDFTKSPNRIVSELWCFIWTLQSLRDLRLKDVVVGLDCRPAYEILNKASEWPRYRFLLVHITMLRSWFDSCSFEFESMGANSIARAIS